MNQVALIGRLTRDPETRYTTTQKAVCSFTVAVDRPRAAGKDKETDFIRVQAWERTAENCEKYLSKGSMVAVSGSIRQNVTEKDGQRKEYVVVKADRVEFIGPKQEQEKPESFAAIQEEIPF